MNYRTEHDTMGEIQVPAAQLWGAQTERSRRNFNIGAEQMPLSLIYGLVRVKKACAQVNYRENLLPQPIRDGIIQVCDEILGGQHDREFPLSVWQTGSGTQTNMNVNEVIANRAAVIATGGCEQDRPVHPNDHVNLSQSSNDVFPSAMHVAAVFALEDHLLPSLASFRQTLEQKAVDFAGIVKIGRTHLQDATPLTLGQEVSGWAAMIESNQLQLREALHHLRFLAIGGTAVGTGLNAPAGFGEAVAAQLSQETGKTFYSAANKFHALTSHDQLVFASGAVKALAANMMKGNQPPKYSAQLSEQAAALQAQGAQLQGYLTSGTLPPGVGASLSAAHDSAAATIRSQYAARGMSGSSAEMQDLNNLAQTTVTQGAQIASNLLATGVSEQQFASGLYQNLMATSMQQDTNMSKAIAGFTNAMANSAARTAATPTPTP